LYAVKGTMKDITNLKLVVMDILLMDIGTAGYTTFDWGQELVTYMMEHEDAENWKWGHIHSHNTMDVFFSSTDVSELNDNSPLHNVYLSLIVNNFMEMMARVAFVGSVTRFPCKDFTGKGYDLILEEADQTMFWYECRIMKEGNKLMVDESFKERYLQVEEEFQKRAKEKAKANPYVAPGMPNQIPYPDYDKSKKEPVDTPAWKWNNGNNTIVPPKEKVTQDELFLCYALRLGYEVINDNLKEVLDDIEQSNINADTIIDGMRFNFYEYYDEFFKPGFSQMQSKDEHIREIFTFALSYLAKLTPKNTHFHTQYTFGKNLASTFTKMYIEFTNPKKSDKHEQTTS